MRSLDLLKFVTDDKANKSALLWKHSRFSEFMYSLRYKRYKYPIVYLNGLVSNRCLDFEYSKCSNSAIPIGLVIKGYLVLAKEPECMSAYEVNDFCSKACIFGLNAQLPPLKLLKYMKSHANKINKQLIEIGGYELRGDWYRSCNSVGPNGTVDDNKKYDVVNLLGIHFNQRNDRAFYDLPPDIKACFRPVFLI